MTNPPDIETHVPSRRAHFRRLKTGSNASSNPDPSSTLGKRNPSPVSISTQEERMRYETVNFDLETTSSRSPTLVVKMALSRVCWARAALWGSAVTPGPIVTRRLQLGRSRLAWGALR